MPSEIRAVPDTAAEKPCVECPLTLDRRAFLRDAGFAAAATLAALGFAPGAAFAESVRAISPWRATARQRAYQLPAADGVAVDVANDVVIARWQGRAYAFSLRCPHRGTRLEWRAGEERIFCPRHKARFRPDGAHDSGRSTRDLDRFDIHVQDAELIVDLDALRQADGDVAAWRAAVVQMV